MAQNGDEISELLEKTCNLLHSINQGRGDILSRMLFIDRSYTLAIMSWTYWHVSPELVVHYTPLI